MSSYYKEEFCGLFSLLRLFDAYLKAKKTKAYRIDLYNFSLEMGANIKRIQKEILDNTYKFGPYKTFILYDSKRRLIVSAPFSDRIVHWVIYEYLNSIFLNSFIDHSYGNIKNKGTSSAVKYCKYLYRNKKNKYVLKIDFSKYFYSIDHKLLKSILRKKVKNDHMMRLLESLIDSYCTGDQFDYLFDNNSYYRNQKRKGIPIGNLTSQIMANIYLNELDHYLKDYLGVKSYIRYVDDLVIFGSSKKELWVIKDLIDNYCSERLRLYINPRKVYIQPTSKPLDFLGYRFYKYKTLPRKRVQGKIRDAVLLSNTDKLVSYKGILDSSDSLLKYQVDFLLNDEII